MKKLFKKGEHVRSRNDGLVMEVLRYIKHNLVAVKRFDRESREVYFSTIKEKFLSKLI